MSGAHYQLFTRDGDHDRDWMRNAQCRINGTAAEIRANAEKYFPTTNQARHIRDAERLCDGCPVTRECHQHAERLDIRYGIWGGHSRQKPDRRGPRPRCGTENAYYRHLAADEPVDPACLAAAHRVWERRKQQRRTKKAGGTPRV